VKTPDPDDVEREVSYAFNLLNSGALGERGVRWFALNPQGQRMGGVARALWQLYDVALTSQRGWSTYVQLNPSLTSGMRASNHEVSELRFLFFDIDPVGSSEPSGMLAEALAQASDLLQCTLDPWIIDSGRGLQAWQEVPVTALTSESRPRFAAALRQLIRRLPTVDKSCSDLARVARLTGSINHKTGRMARLVKAGNMLHTTDWRFRLLELGEEEQGALVAPLVEVGEKTWNDVFIGLTATAQNFILRGVKSPGRHHDAHHTLRLLKERGVSKASATEALYHGALLCLPSARVDKEFTVFLKRIIREEYD
jgi:hypothetical protein